MAPYDQSHLALTPGVGRDDPAPRPLWVKFILALGAVGFGGYALWMLTGPREYVQNRDMVLYCALLVVPFASFLGRALLGGPARRAWWFFAAGAGLWLMAEIGYTATTADVDADPARWVDWSFIIAPLFLYAGVVLLAGVMLPRATVEVWLDGVIIACATAAFATLLFPELMENFSGSVQDVIVDMTSPLTGMLLVSLVLAVIGVVRGAAGAMWWLLLAGATLLWLSDMVWMLEVDESSYFNGSLIDLGWPAGLLLLGAAPWARMRRGTTQPEQGWFVPLSLALATFGLLLYATQQSVPTVTVAFAAGTVMGGALRSVQAFRSASTRAEALRQARSDELTGLANRRGLNLALQLHPDDQHALLLVDIDRFKQINDTLGHQAGDEVLQQVSVRLQGCMGEGAVIGRLGADEFAILMPAGSGWATATAGADRLHDALNPPVSAGGIDLTVEISVGIALSPQHGTTLSELLRTADRAMYRAKRDRMGSLVFDQTWDSSDGGGLLMMQELRKAVDDAEFVCHYQPQLDVLTDEVVCVESLVRWQHPERGLIPAGHFLPMLEQTALIRPLSDLVLKQSLAQLRLWDGQGLRLRISVNLSATNLLDRGLPLRVAQMLAEHQVPAERVTLEITETALTGDQERVRTVLGQLHEIGVQLSIDDYGSGYSSLRQIGRLSAHELKLDRDFVTGVGQRGDLRSILSATVHLAHGLRLRMVAEGVESEADLDQVRLAGCDLAQGYHISTPRAADDLTAWLLARELPAQAHADAQRRDPLSQ